MSNKAATLFLAGAVIAGGTLATVYRDEIGPYAMCGRLPVGKG